MKDDDIEAKPSLMPTMDQRRAQMEEVAAKLLGRLRRDIEFLRAHGIGVTIFAFEFGDEGAVAYISSADRAGMVLAVKKWIALQEAGIATEPRGSGVPS